MADRYIEGLNECSDPAAADWLWIVDMSAAATDRDRKVSGSLVGWTNFLNNFTRGQTITPPTASAFDHGLNVLMPAGTLTTQRSLRVAYDGTLRFNVQTDGTSSLLTMAAYDNGSGIAPSVQVGNNNNASTPVAGFLALTPKTGTVRRLWVDTTGLLRIHTAVPTSAGDGTLGVAVGDQTSSLDSKNIIGEPVSGEQALLYVQEGARAVRRFTYREGSYNGQEFSGLVTDYAPRYGKDRDDEHSSGKSLNTITAIGDMMLSIAHLAERVERLESNIAE